MRICVVGVGNIGLNLLQSLRRAGCDAVGVDISEARIGELARQGVGGVYRSPAEAGPAGAFILTTSTGPNLAHLLGAAGAIEPQPGALISVESTLPVGSMALLAQHFEGRGFTVGQDLFLAHVPHRILFGVEESVFDAPRVVAGVTPACRDRALAFYGPLVRTLFPVSDVRVAELCKIVENTLRYVEVAFAEEIFRHCLLQGLPFGELRGAVNTKGNVRLLEADYGIGGECLPKDIRFLQEALQSSLLTGAMEADDAHRRHLQAMAADRQRILVQGITFKPGYPDVRFSTAVELVRALEAAGKAVDVADPLLTPQDIAALGFTPADPAAAYDLIYERPLRIHSPKEAGPCVEDPGHGQ